MLRQLELTNFKCFESASLALAPLTVLCGQNGSGKSTVIQSLLLLRQSFLQGRLPNIGLSLNGDLVRIGTARDALFQEASDDIIGMALENENATAAFMFSYDPESEIISTKTVNAPELGHVEPLFRGPFQYLCAERVGPRPYFEASDYIVRHQRDLGAKGEFAAHFLQEFKDVPVERSEVLISDAPSHRLLDQVEAWMRQFSPRIRLIPGFQTQMDLASLQFAYETKTGTTNEFRATNVGFGLTYVLPIIVACLALPPGSLLLIENPEVHLHPAAQVVIATLMSKAARSGIQIILETHSDHIVNGVRLAVKQHELPKDYVSILFFEPSGDSLQPAIHSLEIDENGRMSNWPAGFFDQWENSLLALVD